MRRVWISVLLATVPWLIHCGGGDDTSHAGSGGTSGQSGSSGDSFQGSCDTRTNAGGSEGQCRDWYGSSNVDVEVSCNGLGGAFDSSTPCPSELRIGSCVLSAVLGVSATYNYYSPKYSASMAQEHCSDLDGAWKGA